MPYLARGKQDDTLKEFIEKNYPAGKNDLATAFLDRCLQFCVEGGCTSAVLPQSWLYLGSYKKFREKLLVENKWNFIARLGAKGFQTPMWDFNVQLISLSRENTNDCENELDSGLANLHFLRGSDVSADKNAHEKSCHLPNCKIRQVKQSSQLGNPDFKVSLEDHDTYDLMVSVASGYQGIKTSDDPFFVRKYWEVTSLGGDWEGFQSTVEHSVYFGGLEQVVLFEEGKGRMRSLASSQDRDRRRDLQGRNAWGKKGVAVSSMALLPSSIYCGTKFDTNVAIIVPENEDHLLPIWCYCSSKEYNNSVREFDQSLKVTNATLVKVSFDLDRWERVADSEYPNGLPKPFSDDPTQWIYHGHPCGSVIWSDEKKLTVKSELRIDETVLQVAVARLLGYQWPVECGNEFELAMEQCEWVEETKSLLDFADDDGIVCLPVVRGEKAADHRLEELLQAAYRETWSTQIRNQLLESVGCRNKSLEIWLREIFFEQHCKLFQHRPFIWQIWDGLKDGFSALVNYHLLDRKNLERLIYTYLDDWIRTQKHQQSEGIDGAGVRLAAAGGLKDRLEKILEGDAPYDIFVRWKSLEEQSIGWSPDLDDGVRLNVRPFMSVEDVGKKGAGILRTKPNIHWKKDRGKDVESAPWYNLGLEYGGKEGDRINDHHLTLAEKRDASEG